jgi:hypothetical protein
LGIGKNLPKNILIRRICYYIGLICETTGRRSVKVYER